MVQTREPELVELIDEMISSRLLDLHTMLPAKVVSYDRSKHVVEARIMVQHSVPKANGSQLLEDIPPLPNVPVAWPEGGSGPAGNSYYLDFPLVAGNEGMLVFSSAAWGHFRENGQLSPPGDLARHSLSYCSFVPCRISNGGEYESSGMGLLIVPDERWISVRRRGETDDFVALSTKTNAELDAIRADLATFAAAQATASTGPLAALATAFTNLGTAMGQPSGDVACESLKAGPA